MSDDASSRLDDVRTTTSERDEGPFVILNVLLAGGAAALAVCVSWTLVAFVTESQLAFVAMLIGPAVGAAVWAVAGRASGFSVLSALLMTLMGIGAGYLMVHYYAGSQIAAKELAKDDSVVVRLVLIHKMRQRGVVPKEVKDWYLSESFGLEDQLEVSPQLGRKIANLETQTRAQVAAMKPSERRAFVGDRLEARWQEGGAWAQTFEFAGLDYAWAGGSLFLALLFAMGFFSKDEEEVEREVDEVPLAAEPPRVEEEAEEGDEGDDGDRAEEDEAEEDEDVEAEEEPKSAPSEELGDEGSSGETDSSDDPDDRDEKSDASSE